MKTAKQNRAAAADARRRARAKYESDKVQISVRVSRERREELDRRCDAIEAILQDVVVAGIEPELQRLERKAKRIR